MRGTCKFYNHKKGFGFIVPADGGPDVFFHHSRVVGDTPYEDEPVEFERVEGKDGKPAAAGVRLVKSNGNAPPRFGSPV